MPRPYFPIAGTGFWTKHTASVVVLWAMTCRGGGVLIYLRDPAVDGFRATKTLTPLGRISEFYLGWSTGKFGAICLAVAICTPVKKTALHRSYETPPLPKDLKSNADEEALRPSRRAKERAPCRSMDSPREMHSKDVPPENKTTVERQNPADFLQCGRCSGPEPHEEKARAVKRSRTTTTPGRRWGQIALDP